MLATTGPNCVRTSPSPKTPARKAVKKKKKGKETNVKKDKQKGRKNRHTWREKKSSPRKKKRALLTPRPNTCGQR
jgi:hypothetical protein